jgi:putative FmdB family regulatory protein
MPIYEYQCQDCGHELEKLQRISDEALTDCPSCGDAGLKRLVSAAGFRLKGAGWYETDFKKGNQKNLVDSDKPKAADSGDKPKAEPVPKAGEKSAVKNDSAGSKAGAA